MSLVRGCVVSKHRRGFGRVLVCVHRSTIWSSGIGQRSRIWIGNTPFCGSVTLHFLGQCFFLGYLRELRGPRLWRVRLARDPTGELSRRRAFLKPQLGVGVHREVGKSVECAESIGTRLALASPLQQPPPKKLPDRASKRRGRSPSARTQLTHDRADVPVV